MNLKLGKKPAGLTGPVGGTPARPAPASGLTGPTGASTAGREAPGVTR